MSKLLAKKGVVAVAVAFVLLVVCTRILLPSGRNTGKLSLSELAVSDYFARDSGVELGDRVWFVSVLKEMQERPLKEVGSKGAAFRFLWLRSFHQPLCVTAYFPDEGESFISGKVLEMEPRRGKMETFRGDASKDVKITLSDERTASLKKAFEQRSFFSLDPYDEYTLPPIIDFDFRGRNYRFGGSHYIVCDGALWVIEGYTHGRYRVLQRQHPGEEDPVRQLATLLMTEAKVLPKTDREIY